MWAFTALTEQMMAQDLTASPTALPSQPVQQIIRCARPLARSLSPHYVYLNVAVAAAPLNSLGHGRVLRLAESSHDIGVDSSHKS